MKLETLFPDEASTHDVLEPVYAGGPLLTEGVFAVTRNVPENSAVINLMPGLAVVMDSEAIDRIIATSPNEARYFVGLMIWEPDELDDQVERGAWDVRPADVDTALPASVRGLWKALGGTTI